MYGMYGMQHFDVWKFCDPRFSAGVVLYKMLFQRFPFKVLSSGVGVESLRHLVTERMYKPCAILQAFIFDAATPVDTMTVVVRSNHGHLVFQLDQSGSPWRELGWKSSNAGVEMVNQNHLMQLTWGRSNEAIRERLERVTINWSLQLRKFPNSSGLTTFVGISWQVLMSKMLGSLWMQFQGQDVYMYVFFWG